MKHIVPVILAPVAILCAMGTAIAQANGYLIRYGWAMRYLYSASVLLLIAAAMVAIINSKKEAQKGNQSDPVAEKPNLTLTATNSLLVHRIGDNFSNNVARDLRGRFPQHEILVAEIKNASKPSKAVGKAHTIKAELLVTVGGSQQAFGPLAWTGTISNTVSIEMADAKDAILAVRFTKGLVPVNPRSLWRIPINPRSRFDEAPGAELLTYRNLWTQEEVKVRLNLLHLKSGRTLRSFKGTCQWENDVPVFTF
jgi:hypothetical protein